MVKRLSKIVAVLLATGGISLLVPAFAFADNGQAVSNTTDSSVTIDSNSSAQVEVSSSSSSQVGGKVGVGTPGSPSDTSQSGSNTISDGASSSDSQTTGASTDVVTGGGSTSEPADTSGSATTAGEESTADSVVAPATLHEKVVQAIQFNNSSYQTQLAANTSAGILPPVAPSAAPSAPTQRPLPPVQGALLQINGALAAFVVPAAGRLLSLVAASTHAPVQAQTTVLIALLILGSALGSSYLEFLRKSGFHGGARGDDGAATHSFVTPQKVGFLSTQLSLQPTFLVLKQTNAFRKGGEVV